ncbi:MazG-like family protein [Macrococcus sp. DPC7161]|uniref:MazG-like family protein n=1 Tax=Macrococcus sp. DPC7161 TaxID=2507060 RepID=UPI00100C35FA|nr:MazG-like family protein [Macrococcus sp. DPC7161]RXK19066.1 hypothetical protein ER639_01765 [Macrococcus sp. DPC7161]
MSKLLELTELIEAWAIDRDLHTADYKKQLIKLGEETGELYAGVAKNNQDLIIDSIGDAYVVLTILCLQKEFTFKPVVLKAQDSFYKNVQNDKLDPADAAIDLLSATGRLATVLEKSTTVNIHLMHIEWFLGALFEVAKSYDFDLTACTEMAYEEIKDRKGKMINGVFVKEEDL